MSEQSGWFKAAAVLVSLSATIFLFTIFGQVWSFLGDLILTVFFAWLMASILIHIINNLMRVPHMKRPLAIVIVYVGLIALIADAALLLIPATVSQAVEMAESLPQYLNYVPEIINTTDAFLVTIGLDLNLREQYGLDSFDNMISRWSNLLTDNAAKVATSIASALFNIGLAVVLSFYFVIDGGRRTGKVLTILPPAWENEARIVLGVFDKTFHGYIRGLFVISIIYGVGTAAVMIVMDLPGALPVAIISALLLVVPILGDWLALGLPLIVAATQGDIFTFIVVLAVLLFIQQVMLNILTPRILGNAVKMPAMLVIMSLVLGARLAGVWGVLLAVPTAGVIYSLAVAYGSRIRERRNEANAQLASHETSQKEEFAQTAEQNKGTLSPVEVNETEESGSLTESDMDDDNSEAPPTSTA